MIFVVDENGEDREFDGATRFSTDEDNNLCIWTGSDADELVYLFHPNAWREAGVRDDD